MLPVPKISNKIRNVDIVARFLKGETSSELGVEYGLTRQRVIQILSQLGVEIAKGGFALKCQQAQQARQVLRQSEINRSYGTSRATVASIPANVRRAYSSQRRWVSSAGMDWSFNLESWWKVWHESGNFEHRGANQGQFRMRRRDNTQSWGPTTVFIERLGSR